MAGAAACHQGHGRRSPLRCVQGAMGQVLPAAGGAYRLAHHAAGCVPQRALARGAGGAGRRGGRGMRVLACAAAGPAAAAWNQQGCNTSCARFASSPIWRCLPYLSGVELFAREYIWMYAWANLCTPVTAMSLCPPLTALPATPPPAPVLEVQRACHWSTAGRACGHARLPHRHAGGLVSCTLLCLYSCDVVSRCCCGQECGVSAAACRCPYASGWAVYRLPLWAWRCQLVFAHSAGELVLPSALKGVHPPDRQPPDCPLGSLGSLCTPAVGGGRIPAEP